ncbi:hypothetical protein RHMOL_Rhmol11G0060500 [Rhododendron molle]|uniref:Uncharacterized protein n=1 Tax=Rhododendron molle TaxID=49168 RepID=A0ACC0LNV0_RHOML|nr:hypothetical protein RHMOL_Rhmol11G0060500 [Rhododendron molle]
MAEIDGANGKTSRGDGGEQSRVGVKTSRPPVDNQPMEEAPTSTGAGVSSSEGNSDGHSMKVSDGGDRRMLVAQGRMPMAVGSEGPLVHQLDSRGIVEGFIVTGGGFGEGSCGSEGSSGSGGDDRPVSPSRDLERGKGLAFVEETPREAPVEQVEFVSPVGSSRHDPITSSDLAEFIGEAALAQRMEENPAVVGMVLAAREETLRMHGSLNATDSTLLNIQRIVFLRGVASSRGHGDLASSLELYRALPERVRELMDDAGFGLFILTPTVVKSDHAVLIALAERWQDTSNTFHFPIGEITVTPLDFAASTGLRVGGEPIPFDSGIHRDKAALRWFLRQEPVGGDETVWHDQLRAYLQDRIPTTVQDEEQMARAYLVYLFGVTLYSNKRATVHRLTCRPFVTYARSLGTTGEEQL